MIPELILAIAQLCIIPTGTGGLGYSFRTIQREQLICQQFYIECISTNHYTLKTDVNADKLATCITLRRLEK